MTSRRLPSDGGSARSTVLPGSCTGIGRQLAGVRAARGLSVEDVASRLLLSRAQVRGLETASAASFYTPAYFLKGLRKYMAFAGVPEELLDLTPPDDAKSDDPEALRLTLACDDVAAGPATVRFRSRAWAVAGAAILTVGALAGGIRSGPGASADAALPEALQLASLSPLPAEPLLVSTRAALPVEPKPAVSIADSVAIVRLSVGKATWVFVRFPDNEVTERRLAPGEAFEVGSLPIYLAIGTADLVDLQVGDRVVPVEPYVKNGQVRITRPQLAALTAGPVQR